MQAINEDYQSVTGRAETGRDRGGEVGGALIPFQLCSPLTKTTWCRWPCDTAAIRLEFTCAAMGEATCKDGLCWNPRPGELEEVMSSTASEPRRILDLGGSVSLLSTSLGLTG